VNVARIKTLREQAQQALDQYSADTFSGGEPVFPQWARDVLDLTVDFGTASNLLVDGMKLMPHSSAARKRWTADVVAFINRIHMKESK